MPSRAGPQDRLARGCLACECTAGPKKPLFMAAPGATSDRRAWGGAKQGMYIFELTAHGSSTALGNFARARVGGRAMNEQSNAP